MKSAIFIAKPETSAAELAAVTGIYPQLAYYYRRTQSFPASRKGTYKTSELIKYLRKNGWEIELV
ncbi:hypothetical protein MR829_08155 [Paracoccus versutus]|uniref:hypothetical protein n=1 Tax=Paracoccus versutus TaxID=34007 RepID=UPI001FB640A8|nr:hypothetical protein [Paracoccus versutus]MCJ1900348.1 hypothetical protein [Paracoccus versutus]